MGNACMLFLGT